MGSVGKLSSEIIGIRGLCHCSAWLSCCVSPVVAHWFGSASSVQT